MSFKISTQDFITSFVTPEGVSTTAKVQAGNVIQTSSLPEITATRPEQNQNRSQNFSLEIKAGPVMENTLVTPWAARQMIKERFENEWDDASKQNEKLAVEFSKKMLLIILSQNDCEGIRFSFCKFNGEITLVAFGIEKDGKLIGEEMFKDGFIHEADIAPPPGSEQGHGITIGQFKEQIKQQSEDPSVNIINFNKATDLYFQSLNFK